MYDEANNVSWNGNVKLKVNEISCLVIGQLAVFDAC